MTLRDITDPATLRPTLTADGRKWVQRCYLCRATVNFLKMKRGAEYVTVGSLVRHKRCLPVPIR